MSPPPPLAIGGGVPFPISSANRAIKVEYTRLVHVALQDQAPESDHRLRHPIVYFLQNQAPKKVWERMLFEQFADSSLGSDERYSHLPRTIPLILLLCKAAVKVAHQKLDLIKTDEAEMAEYELWHRDYQKFLEVTVFLLIGVELFRKKSYAEALVYLVYSSQCNKELLLRGPARGHSQELLANYRRACLLVSQEQSEHLPGPLFTTKLNTRAAALFEAGSKAAVSEGLEILMELVVPCMPFLLASDAADGTQEADLAAVETVRNCWCSYLDQEMEPPILEKLTEFLPKLLDCCGETRSFCPPPRLPSCSTQELCERFRRVVTSQKHTPSNGT
ncbi:hypothetical protein JZ751_012752 [Albula glossodonta]|uniref:Uncharacterized protein n=2 Tax=Albula glossodonta TaxID=121402 RepID=A0A8T2MZY0_9TELE|nr:hypothetical protein JZ751_012752 [Albula glossodonta]